MRMEQRQEQRLVVRLVLEAARWGWRRNIEPVEGFSYVAAVGWGVSLLDSHTFESSPTYGAMARLTTFATVRWDVAQEVPWACAIWVIIAHLTLSYLLGAWGYVRQGYWDDDMPTVFWSRRLRFGGLLLLAAWWAFVAGMLGYASSAATGWKVYAALSLWTSWSALRLVWDYGAGVLPLIRGRGA